jgi:hypothetical protein
MPLQAGECRDLQRQVNLPAHLLDRERLNWRLAFLLAQSIAVRFPLVRCALRYGNASRQR